MQTGDMLPLPLDGAYFYKPFGRWVWVAGSVRLSQPLDVGSVSGLRSLASDFGF